METSINSSETTAAPPPLSNLQKLKKMTITLINPWTNEVVETEVSEVVKNLGAYCWPDEVTSELSGMVETDEEWVTRAVEIMGSKEAGKVIIGA